MGAIREITRIVRVTELVKKVEEAVEATKFPVDRAMRIRIHYDPAASTCGVVIDADGAPDDFGNAKLFVPCDSVCWLGAAWSPFAYRIAFIMEYRTAAVMNRAAKLLGERYGVPFVYENLNPYARYLSDDLSVFRGESEEQDREIEACNKMRRRFTDDFPAAATRVDVCRRENRSYTEEYFVICRDISEMEKSTARLYSCIARSKEQFGSEKEYEAFKKHLHSISSSVTKLHSGPRIVNAFQTDRKDKRGVNRRRKVPLIPIKLFPTHSCKKWRV